MLVDLEHRRKSYRLAMNNGSRSFGPMRSLARRLIGRKGNSNELNCNGEPFDYTLWFSNTYVRICANSKRLAICVWPGFVATAQSKEVTPSTSEFPIEKCKHVLLLPCDLCVLEIVKGRGAKG